MESDKDTEEGTATEKIGWKCLSMPDYRDHIVSWKTCARQSENEILENQASDSSANSLTDY